MNKFLILIFFVLVGNLAFGQTESRNSGFLNMNETDSLYLIAIKKYISEIDAYGDKTSQQDTKKIIFIEYQDYLVKIPDSINGYKIQKIGLGNRKKIFRKNKNGLSYVKIFPLSIKEGEFNVTLIPYFAELKRRNNLFLSLSVWTEVSLNTKMDD